MSSIDQFLRQVSIISNNYVLDALTTPADEKRLSIAESHFALMIRADTNGEGAKQARSDARWNYFWTLQRLFGANAAPTGIVNLVNDFERRVSEIGHAPQNRLDLPGVLATPSAPSLTH